MDAGARTDTALSQPESDDVPDIAICESCPGKAVFLESGNTDGWIASNLTVEVDR